MSAPAMMCTSRLMMSRPTPADVAGVYAIAGDPGAVEHDPSDLLVNAQEASELVARWIKHWDDHGFGYWCIREKDSDRMIGYCGVRWTTVKGRAGLNLIYRFAPEVWGRGYATEVGKRALLWATENLPGQLVVARIRRENHLSQRVALKIGLTRDRDLDSVGEDGVGLGLYGTGGEQ